MRQGCLSVWPWQFLGQIIVFFALRSFLGVQRVSKVICKAPVISSPPGYPPPQRIDNPFSCHFHVCSFGMTMLKRSGSQMGLSLIWSTFSFIKSCGYLRYSDCWMFLLFIWNLMSELLGVRIHGIFISYGKVVKKVLKTTFWPVWEDFLATFSAPNLPVLANWVCSLNPC